MGLERPWGCGVRRVKHNGIGGEEWRRLVMCYHNACGIRCCMRSTAVTLVLICGDGAVWVDGSVGFEECWKCAVWSVAGCFMRFVDRGGYGAVIVCSCWNWCGMEGWDGTAREGDWKTRGVNIPVKIWWPPLRQTGRGRGVGREGKGDERRGGGSWGLQGLGPKSPWGRIDPVKSTVRALNGIAARGRGKNIPRIIRPMRLDTLLQYGTKEGESGKMVKRPSPPPSFFLPRPFGDTKIISIMVGIGTILNKYVMTLWWKNPWCQRINDGVDMTKWSKLIFNHFDKIWPQMSPWDFNHNAIWWPTSG